MRLLALAILASGLLPGKTIVLKAARLFDGKSNSLSRPGVVVINGSRIEGVGEGALIPAGAEAIDLGDATLLPGFMDAHTHLRWERSDEEGAVYRK